MAGFVVKKLSLDDLADKSAEFTHKDTGVKITFNASSDKRFQKANELLTAREKADIADLKTKPLDDSFLDSINGTDKSASEIWLHAVAKFLIVDWDVVDESGDKLEVTGDNFVLLISNVDSPSEFIEWCMTCANNVATQKTEKTAETKKKPSRATSGKKATPE